MKVCIARNTEARVNASVIRVTDALTSSGHAVCLLTRNRFNDGKGIRRTAFTTSGRTLDNFEISLPARPGRGLVNIFQLLAFQRSVYRWLKRNQDKYDVIHAFDLDVGLPASWIARRTGKKYVYHIADFYVDSRHVPGRLRSWIRDLEYKVIEQAWATIICTEARAQQIEGSRPKQLTVVHNTPAVSEELLAGISRDEAEGKAREGLVLTYVGSLSDARFIGSALAVIRKHPDIRFVIAGFGRETEKVAALSRQYSNIDFRGIIDYEEAIRLYGETDLMLAVYDPKYRNHKFAAPNKVYEAMLLGRPIIVAPDTGMDEIVLEHDMGYVIDYSEEAFEALLERLLKAPPAELEAKGRNAAKAYPKYSWPVMKQRLIGLYQELQADGSVWKGKEL